MILNYTYRLYPDAAQIEALNEWLETCRVSYNFALRELKDWIASRKCPIDRCSLKSEYIMSANYPFPGYHQQQNNLPKAKKKFPRLKAVPSQVLQTNIRRLHDSWDDFRKRGFGFPRYKKYGRMKSILFPQFKTNPLTDWTVQLPKIGKVKFNLHRPIPEGFSVKQVRVVKKADRWFATIAIQSAFDFPEVKPHGHPIGIDVGLTSYVSSSDGFQVKRPKFFKTAQSRLRVLQRRLSRKKRGGKNYEKARLKVERQYNYIAAIRLDYQFNLAHKLCDMADTIYLEDCDFRVMAKGFLGKHTIDAAFGQLRSIIEYVALKRGKFTGRVDHKGTSQTCSSCRCEVRKDLSVRVHKCFECGYIQDRDVVSGQEICNRGQELYRGNSETQEIDSQVGLSGNMVVDKWRKLDESSRRVNVMSAMT